MSVLTLYKTNITPDRNACVDSINDYLADNIAKYGDESPMTFTDFQYQKIKLDMTFDVPIAQSYIKKQFCNYAKVTQDGMDYYFFITDNTRLSEKATRLTARLDTINTFRNKFTISSKSNVLRQHKNRFKTTDRFDVLGFNLHPVIDKIDEGISPLLLKKSDEIIKDITKADTNWYLIYETKIADTESKPFEVWLLPKTQVPYDTGYSASVTITPLVIGSNYFVFFGDENGGGDDYIYWQDPDNPSRVAKTLIEYLPNGNIAMSTTTSSASWTFTSEKVYHYSGTDPSNLSPFVVRAWTTGTIKAGAVGTAYLDTIDTIDRSQPNIAKIIELPYLPDDNITWTGDVMSLTGSKFERVNQRLHLKSYVSEFERTIKEKEIGVFALPVDAMTKAAFTGLSYDKKYESKLLNSAFYNYKLAYDVFATSIDMEKINNPVYNQKIKIKFKPSNNLSSELAFKWELQQSATYESLQDYYNVLISNRNNEIGLYTSEYLNYLRIGYNYDMKQKNRNVASSWIASGLMLGAGALDIAFGTKVLGVGMITSALANIANSVKNTIDSEKTLEQKLKEYENQSASIRDASAIDLFNWYNGNKIHLMIYQPSNEMTEQLTKLFHYCGYNRNRQEAIETNTRIRFNFVQAEVLFESWDYTIQEFLNDIKQRFAIGVTYYHVYNGEYDWNQSKENWETFLFTE